MTNIKDKAPWWWPSIIDDAHLARLREDYPEKSGWGDDELLEYFDNGKEIGQFSTTWDHIGDAYPEYENLARAFLDLVKETGKKPSDFL